MKYATLSAENIDAAADALRSYLQTTTLGRADCIRTVFAAEEALLQYRNRFGEGTPFILSCGKRWGREQFFLSLRGESYNPFVQDDEDDEIPSIVKSMMGQMGVFPNWRYSNGTNTIGMLLPKETSSPLLKLGASIVLAFVLYGIGFLLPSGMQADLYTYAITPLIDVFSGMLSAISGPLIFCSITYSICSMGDITTFGKIGKHTVIAIVKAICIVVLIGIFWMVFLYPPQANANVQSGNAFFEIYQMILDIVPSNLMISFVDNNPMQIVTMALVLGFTLLVLGKTTAGLVDLVAQFNHAFQYIMQLISSYIHIFVFLCVLGMLLSGQFSTLLETYLLVVYLLIAMFIEISYTVGRACIKTGVSPIILFKKVAPTFFVALTTASSTAAFSTNITGCKKNLGIADRLADFGVPFGQVIYMPASALFFGVFGFYMYNAYGLEVGFSTLVMLFLLCVILSIALPPIPGGSLIVVNILFLQLGIPDAGLALAVIFLTIYTFPATALNVCSLQLELLCVAKDLDLLDDAVLKSTLTV